MRYPTSLVLFVLLVKAAGQNNPCPGLYGVRTTHGERYCEAHTRKSKRCNNGAWVDDGACSQNEAYCTGQGMSNYMKHRSSLTCAVTLFYCCAYVKFFDCAELPLEMWQRLLVTGILLVAIGLCCSFWSYLEKPRMIAQSLVPTPIVHTPTCEQHDGFSLHQKVPMDRWCVTYEDLVNFKKLVEEEVKAGRIVPTELDPFDPKDHFIGPTMYTVNDQYIKPVTAEAGDMSWALMLHPEGLQCDIFITHGWKEGIYELVDSVISSWPRGMKAAYCCVLSNPQNLDISSLIGSPEDSPFAVNLRSARCVLAVPNHTESIYARLWCSFEAYYAYVLNKPIYTCIAPIPNLVASIRFCAGLYFIASGTVLILTSIFTTAADPVTTHTFWLVINGVCQILGVSVFFWYFIMRTKTKPETLPRRIFTKFVSFFFGLFWSVDSMLKPYHFVTWFLGLLVVLVIAASFDVGRLRAISAKHQAAMLHVGFTGHVCDAQCSREDDAIRIREEIRKKASEAEVDQAVSVLIEMGMSTSYLRDLQAQVGTLGSQIAWSITTFFAFPTAFICVPLSVMDVYALWRNPFLWVCVVEGAIWVLVFYLLPEDCKKFAVGIGGCVACACIVCVALNLYFLSTFDFPPRGFIIDFWAFSIILPCIAGPFAVMLAIAGPLRISRVPKGGKLIVRAMCGRPFILNRFKQAVNKVGITAQMQTVKQVAQMMIKTNSPAATSGKDAFVPPKDAFVPPVRSSREVVEPPPGFALETE
eukprot:TRINITY_DN4572_c0_g2_i1.p1 TRINITY_DN4572_c0_g2~~TRINITY_DN4572_c0_g2_i1.p1  ORF type:complete len:754 (-),score=39.97 TRINITY_DN4572_c0_g2_i1:449-2710(-)